jgi:hypothetical protein
MKKLLLSTAAALLISTGFMAAGPSPDFDGDTKEGVEKKKKQPLNAAIWHRKDGTVSVNFEKKPDEVVIIKIFNDKETLILQDAFRKETLVTYRYDLSRLPSGDYYFEVTNKNDVLRKEISVD